MKIELTDLEAEWLEMLRKVHECDVSDMILVRIADARMREVLSGKRECECEQQQAEARGNLYGAPNVW